MYEKRGKNFTKAEKEYLFELINNKYCHIIDNKVTTGSMIAQKNEAWNEVTKEFNTICESGTRDVGQLRKLYKNLKTEFRRQDVKNVNIKSETLKNNDIEEKISKKIVKNTNLKKLLLSQAVKNDIDEKTQRQTARNLTVNQLKKIYYKKQIRNADFQFWAMREKHNLEKQILKKQLNS